MKTINNSAYFKFIKKVIPTFLFVCLSLIVFSATPSDISIIVKDGNTGEPLIGVNIYTPDFKFTASTDFDGKASLKGLNYYAELIFSYVGYAQTTMKVFEIKKSSGIVKLFPDVATDTIVVIGRRDDPVSEIPYEVAKVDAKDIYLKNAQTTVDALSYDADIYVQKSQMGGGSPIIRGFEANRVLLVVDGVRMNNAIYRNGHLQNAISVDGSLLERAEVIYGPGSLMYGSDALGGVVHFRTKDPQLLFATNRSQTVRNETNFYTRFSSANKEKKIHLDFNYGRKKWAMLISGSFTDYDALVSGSKRPDSFPDFGKRFYFPIRREGVDQIVPNVNPDRQLAIGFETKQESGYSQPDFMTKFRYQPNDKLYFILNYQFSTTSNVPRYDKMVELSTDNPKDIKYSEWYYGPQKRNLISFKTRLLNENFIYDKGTIILGYQKIDEDRFSRKFGKARRSVNKEDVFVYSATADFDKYLDSDQQNQISYGASYALNFVNSVAYKINIVDKIIEIENVNTRYPSAGSSMENIGYYGNYRWKSKNQVFTFNAGARYSTVKLNAKYLEDQGEIDWPEVFYSGIENNNSALTWGAGFTVNTKNKWQIRASVAKAFRAPNIDDFAKIRAKKGKVTTPNIGLKPETSINTELTIGKGFGDKNGTQFTISGTAFYTQLKDAIVRKDTSNLEDGVDKLLIGDEWNDVQMNVNAEQAVIKGLSGNILLTYKDILKFKSSLNIVNGTTVFSNSMIDTIVPFGHIPPMYGNTSLSFSKNKFDLEFAVRYNAAKPVEEYSVNKITDNGTIKRNGTSDNIEDTATKIVDGKEVYVGALGWTTYNFYSTYHLSKAVSFNFAVENILDLHYRTFASGISAPGRNFIVAFKVNL